MNFHIFIIIPNLYSKLISKTIDYKSKWHFLHSSSEEYSISLRKQVLQTLTITEPIYHYPLCYPFPAMLDNGAAQTCGIIQVLFSETLPTTVLEDA